MTAKLNDEATFSSSSTVGMSDFLRGEKLGQGGFGRVIFVKKKTGSDAGQEYAMKISLNSMEKVEYEREILETVKNVPFLMQIHYAFENQGSMCLVLKYLIGGDLHGYIGCPLNVATFIIAELVLAVGHLHRLDILHRDIKLRNVMLDEEGHTVLADFGAAVQFTKDNRSKMVRSTLIGTTKGYAAPEIVGNRYYGFPADWWAVGVLTHELLTGNKLFCGRIDAELHRRTIECEPNIDQELPVIVKNFIKALVVKNQYNRLGSNGGANELKRQRFFEGIDWIRLADQRVKSPIKECWDQL